LKEAIIHLPPLPEQKRIADIFDQADAVRAQRRVGVETLGALELSIFLEMSGDPATNPMGWPTAPLSSLVRPNDKINYGVVQPGEHVDDGVPVIRVGDLLGGRVVHDRLKRLDPRIEATYARSRLEGDEILVSCVGTIGVIALADESVKGFNIARAVARIPLDTGTDRVYLSAQLRTDAIQRYFISELRTVSQPTLNIKQLSEAIVMVPPLRLQATYGDRIRSLHAVRERQRASLVLLDNLFASLQHRAFRGEL
jgi:type I restriction enzyme S subunit